MSQVRVTDFYAQRKKRIAGSDSPTKLRSRGSTRAARLACTQIKDALICSLSTHEEFVRVIDEAAGLNEGKTISNTTEAHTSIPQIPKRTSDDAEFDFSSTVYSSTADHSTAKKRRHAEAVRDAKKSTSKSARKKLVLPALVNFVLDAAQPQPTEVSDQPSAPATSVCGQDAKNWVNVTSGRNSGGQDSKALHKDDIAALKSALQRIKKHSEEMPSTASSASPPTVSSSVQAVPAHNNTTPNVPRNAPHPKCDAMALKLTMVRAKELAAKAQRRNEKSGLGQTQIQDGAELPAYQRYHTLTQTILPGLSLPYQYKVLSEMFRSMDTVVAVLFNRSETVTFTKVKQGVQDMMHRRFEESHLGQIKTVFEKAYTFRQEKNIPTLNSSIRKGCYQLTVEPVIVSDQNKARPVLSASLLLERRCIFHQNLVSIVKQHHKVFLSSLVPPVSVPDDKLTRWHPRFNVDTVPAIQTTPLPQPPNTEKLATAQEVLKKARSLITPKMEKALVSLAQKTEDKAADSKETALSQNPVPVQTSARSAGSPTLVPTALKGVSQSLLDRIRAKEAQNLQVAMTRNSAQEERLLMMSRLGELARILRNVFVVEKKPALIMEVACNRMVASYKSAISVGEMEKHIRLLAELASEWLSIHPIRKDFYLKLNKNMELSMILDKLSSRLREEERL